MPLEAPVSLQDFSFEELAFISENWGFPAFRREQVFLAAQQNKEYDKMNVPKDLKDKLKESYHATAVKIAETLSGKDGTEKYLFKLNDGNVIEGVFMPHNYGNTLCVSTQVGCRMNCSFCASGLNGLVRNLSSGEILGQALAVNALKGGTLTDRKVTNIVLMGSGEPLDNYDNVIKFLRLASHPKGLNMSLRNISLSTSGLVDKIKKLALEDLPVTLTISLHAPDDETRSEIMPVNKKYNIASLIDAARYYFDKTGRRIIFEYSLIDGKNCDAQSALKLARVLKGLPCHVNLINLNYVKERGLRGVSKDTVKEFSDTLSKENISVTLRRSMGNDIEGACGQLRNKYIREGGNN
ncbi:MAG TPA: 23S rRNA (adenine(2503)-C(2))-methyltransferase RlmN [Clostridia bacterium]|jgi:23S rRNA (adenine2503-C2)-methyltransferase|nr:23S rRNA (adenine(2503)-C(2))-methyltransferase RlmN [Clostridia bacterium]